MTLRRILIFVLIRKRTQGIILKSSVHVEKNEGEQKKIVLEQINIKLKLINSKFQT